MFCLGRVMFSFVVVIGFLCSRRWLGVLVLLCCLLRVGKAL